MLLCSELTKTLKEGLEKMKTVAEGFHDVKTSDRGMVWNQDLVEALELQVFKIQNPEIFY